MSKTVFATASGLAVLSSLALAQSQPAAAAVTKYRSTGTAASAYWFDACNEIYIDVSDGNSAAGSQDFLYYYGYNYCNGTSFYGNGIVPDSAIRVSSNKNEVFFNLDVESVDGFYYYGTPLVGNITFSVDGTCSSKFSGTGRTVYSNGLTEIYKYNSISESYCADASGSIQGPAFLSGTTHSAYIYSHRDISRQFVRD